MNITKGKLILIMCIPLAIALAWGILTTSRLSTSEATQKQTLVTLTQTQNALADTKQQLTDEQTELTTAQNTLIKTQTVLSQTQTQLNTANTELSDTQTQLSNTQTQLSNTQSQLSNANSELSSTRAQLSDSQAQLTDAQSQLSGSQQQLADYKKTMQALGITVHSSTETWDFNGLSWPQTDNPQATNPTWNQLNTFVAQDPTDEHPYDINAFNCVNYATTIYNDAEKSKIESAVVIIELKNSAVGHAANAFISSDYGLVYVDCTQHDTIARIEVGKPYRAVALGTIPPSQIRNDAWWDALSYDYYYLPVGYGGQAIVDNIDIYW